jgi:hypothetical protein
MISGLNVNGFMKNRRKILLFFVLTAAGLIGNYFPFSILNAHFISGAYSPFWHFSR